MELINCPDCGRKVSDEAKFCIHCGRPLKYRYQPKNILKSMLIAFLLLWIPSFLISACIDGIALEIQVHKAAKQYLDEYYSSYSYSDEQKMVDALREGFEKLAKETGKLFTTSIAKISFYLLWLGGTAFFGYRKAIKTRYKPSKMENETNGIEIIRKL